MDARFLGFLAISTLLIMTPGPDMALVTRSAIRSGRRAASFTGLGVAAGIMLWGVASGLGLAVLLDRSAIAFTVLKFAGAAYLVYLGVRGLVRRESHDAEAATGPSSEEARATSPRSAFLQGLLGNLLNPKAGVIFVTVLPQFISPGDPPLRLLAMLLAFEVILVAWLNLYGYLIDRAGRSQAGRRVRKVLSNLTSAVLIGLGARVAVEQR